LSASSSPARLLLTPFYAGSIWLETEFARLYPERELRFPRDLTELERKPARFFELLRQAGVFSTADTLIEVRRRGTMVNEPDKDRTAAIVDVVVQRSQGTVVHPIFVKVQSGRGMPLLLQAVRAAVEPGVAREIDFYRRLAGKIPLRTARPHIAEALTQFNRVFLATEYVEGHNPADWRGCPLPAIRAVLSDVARLNASFVGRTASDPRTSWIPARAGLDYASFVATLAGSPPAGYLDLWKALERYFRERPITLVHGDCRPGNMLFRDAGELSRHAHPRDEAEPNPWPSPNDSVPEVTFTDWEAVNAAPLLWDFTYCTVIGMRSADRRAHLPRLLEEFTAVLRAEGVSAELCDLERCRLEVELLSLVLYYIAALVVSKGYWDNQGNTLEDFHAWSGRILHALRSVDADRAARALGVDVEAVRRLQREGTFKARVRPLGRASSTRVQQIMRDQGDAGWLRLTEQYGRVFRYGDAVVTAEPSDFQALLSLRPHTLRRPLPHRFADRFVPGARGILFKDGDAWKKRLRTLMAGFNPQAVAAGESRLRAIVERYVESWPARHQGADLFAEVSALGLQIALVHGYNLDPSDPVVREFGQTLVAYKASTMHPDARRRLDELGLDWHKVRDLPRIGAAFYEFRGHARRLDALVTEIQRKKPWADPDRPGWIQALSASGLRGRQLSDELNHLYGAFTAADYTTTCALAELARAPEWLRRVRHAEQASDALDAILRETSRRYPVAMVIYRELGEPMTLGGQSFPEGTLVMALPYALNHDPAWWERPLDFDPARFQRPLPAQAAAAYEPFLKGPRRCIGEDFARQQMRVVLSTLLNRFDLEVDARPRVNGFIVPRLAQSLAFRFERRFQASPALPREQHDARPDQ
jgi:cytochrome P450